ncbi:MAG: hypothetical protein AB7N80_11935 [Bdellovibrionales bacterium]
MKNLVLVVLGFLIIGLVAKSGWDRLRHRQQQELVEGTENPETLAPPVSDIKDLIGRPVDTKNGEINPRATPVCQQFWRLALESTLREWFQEVEELGWNHPAECLAEEPQVATVWAQAAEQVCNKTPVPPADPSDMPTTFKKNSDECYTALLNYRTQMLNEIFRNKRNYVDMPVSLLLTKLYAVALDEKSAAQVPTVELLSMAESLTKREPHVFSIRKLVAMALFSGQRKESDPALKNELNVKLNEHINSADTMERSDKDLQQLRLLIQSDSGDEDAAQEVPAPPVLDILSW